MADNKLTNKLKYKSFNSLLRGGGVRPTNTLTSFEKISPEKYNSSSLIAKAESTRKRLDSLESKVSDHSHKSGANSYSSSSSASPKLAQSLLPLSVSPKSRYVPAVSLHIRSIWYDNRIKKSSNSSLEIHISNENDVVYFTQNSVPIEELELKKSKIKRLGLSENCIVIQLDGNRTILANHSDRDAKLRDYFRSHRSWNVDVNHNISEDYVHKLKASLRLKHDPISNISLNTCTRSRTPENSYFRTRSKAREESGNNSSSPIDIGDSEFTFVPRQVPAKFSPDLKYKFSDKKSFTISFSDFKTLYNNEWINDTVIDFFIQYEINSAIKEGLFKEDEIHAFNSFFFTKLMTRVVKSEKPNYYENIKRWLTKVDVMKIPYLIIPINEQSHWYCCIIRGLPDLLNYVKSLQSQLQSEQEQSTVIDQNSDNNEPSGVEGKPELVTSGSDSVIPKKTADVFVFDSLAHKHSNISSPLKTFIIDYCKDAYGVEIEKTLIRVQHVRVPIQNNFNDCGIHVIYNVRKWLHHTAEIEKMWKGTYSKQIARQLFNAEERNGMRKQLIEILLELHKNQDLTPSKSLSESNAEEGEDDDIEVIEFDEQDNPFVEKTDTSAQESNSEQAESTKEKGEKEEQKVEEKSEQEEEDHHSVEDHEEHDQLNSFADETTNNDTPERSFADNFMGIHGKSDTESTPTKISYSTLDPRAKESSRFVNHCLERKFSSVPVSTDAVAELNTIFDKRNIIPSSKQLEIVSNYIDEDTSKRSEGESYLIKKKLLSELEKLSSIKQTRPRDEVLNIKHTSDISDFMDSEEINESVNGVSNLQISSTRESLKNIFESDSEEKVDNHSFFNSQDVSTSSENEFKFELPKEYKSPVQESRALENRNEGSSRSSPQPNLSNTSISSPKNIHSSTPTSCSSKRRRVI